ncbi:SRPBCC family protein [Nocardioides alkalitolerans]|uniref:SRPBCC family protein n=1 Tax=Nocardioides alkalitolerans TaxID=281714 RepID=UPI00041356B4|nr:carbon monoxide dehydrogenase subunit G [Nocardioides alkalitolerans]
MKITGDHVLPFPPEQVWDALLDPQVLVATIPGCERLETTGENAYGMTVSAGVASIKGTYDGTCVLSDLAPHDSLVMRLQGAGAPGTIGATVNVAFAPTEDGTRITYDADAVVGGMVGGVGQRMLTSVAKRMAKEFFGNVTMAVADGPVTDAPAAAEPGAAGVPAASGGQSGAPAGGQTVGQQFRRPAASGGSSSGGDFLTGVAVGAGLVTFGVVLGSVLGRRR